LRGGSGQVCKQAGESERKRENRNGPGRPKPNSPCHASPPSAIALSRQTRRDRTGPMLHHVSYGQRRAPSWLQRMWRDGVVLSRQPRWRNQKGQFVQILFFISIKILIKIGLKIKKNPRTGEVNSWSVFFTLIQIDGIHAEWYLMLNKINKILQFHISIREVKIGYHSAYTYFHSHLQELCMRPQNETNLNLCIGNYGVTDWMGCIRKHPLG